MLDLNKIQWGNGAITKKDWDILRDFIKKHNIKSIIEYGYGVSTTLFYETVRNVTTYESHKGYFKQGKINGFKIILWNADGYLPEQHADFVFIDGPAGGINREWSFKNAARQGRFIAVHDASRPAEKLWIEKHLNDFTMIMGGHLSMFEKGASDAYR